MKLYLAPMEGITRWGYRRIYHKHFGHIDRYFTPFISPGGSKRFTHREMQEILPEHNQGMEVIPQLLTCRSEDFIWAAKELKGMGYGEVNLNLGCPSGTVTAKKKGAGFLAYPQELDEFLAQIFERLEMRISIKTRLGKEEPEEFYRILEIYNRYPVSELIIHPRVQKEFYQGQPHWEIFGEGLKRAAIPVCYNGDINSLGDFGKLLEEFPQAARVMIGRGLLRDPFLAWKIKEEEEGQEGAGCGQAGQNWRQIGQVGQGCGQKSREGQDCGQLNRTGQRYSHLSQAEKAKRVKAFHDEFYRHCQEEMSGEKNVLFRMKELWPYLLASFRDSEKAGKAIRKSRNGEEYRRAVEALFRENEFMG